MFPHWKFGLAVGAVLLLVAGYLKAQSDGYALAQSDARRQVVEQLTERNQINESVSSMSAADLCRELGGVFIDGRCD